MVSAADLAAAYLGTVSLGTLHRAGRITAGDPAILFQAEAMFSWHVQPWTAGKF